MTRYATELIVTISLLQVMMFYPHNFVWSARYMYFHHFLYLTEYLSTVLNQEGNMQWIEWRTKQLFDGIERDFKIEMKSN